MRCALASILFFGCSSLAYADVESGPKAGDKVAALKVHAVAGTIEDKEVDYAKERKDEPTVYLFVNAELAVERLHEFVHRPGEVLPAFTNR